MGNQHTFRYRCEPASLRPLGQTMGIAFTAVLVITLAAVLFISAYAICILVVAVIICSLLRIFLIVSPPTMMVSTDQIRLGKSIYNTRALKRIEVFRVTPPPNMHGNLVIVFVFEKERRPRRVPLFVTGDELKEIIMGIKPILGDVRISIKINRETPVNLIL